MSLFQQQNNEFAARHIGPRNEDTKIMLETIGVSSLEELIDKTVPDAIRMKAPLAIPGAMSEAAYLRHIQEVSMKNELFRNYIGQGYYDTHTPSVILRNIFENPGWYTQYTPYQAEIAQGRLESLLNYQTMICELTAMPIANASLLDEGTAAGEAMTMFFHTINKTDTIERPKFFVDQYVFAQTKDVLLTRAQPL
jgi:glycine dehydrogenase